MRFLILISLLGLTACGETRTEYVYVSPEFGAETLTPCAISERKVKTVNELAILATEHLRTAECANGKIETIAQIVKKE